MHLDALYLQNIRNIPLIELSFAPGINCISGANGQGKSSILEAIHLLIMGSSFRTHNIKEIVQYKMEGLFTEATILLDGGVYRKLSLGYNGERRIVSVNNEVLPSSSLLFGILIGITSTPGDCELIFGSPSERRYFIDEQIAQIDPNYVYHVKRFQRALQQRNMLLKQKQLDGIEAWEAQIAKASAYICRERYMTLHRLKPYFQKHSLTILSEIDHCDIEARYVPSIYQITTILEDTTTTLDEKEFEIEATMKKIFSEKRDFEVRAGTTLYSPQRDDISFIWDGGVSIKSQASLGQAKAISLALRLAEWNLLEERSVHGKPIFLMDDLESFLDQKIVNAFLNIAEYSLGQVIITSHKSLSDRSAIHPIHIHKGTLIA